MSAPRHEDEVDRNRAVWERKALLRDVYASMVRRVEAQIDRNVRGRVVEIGSGIGAFGPRALLTDSFVRPWLDVSLDAYALPFRAGTLSHLIAFDVFHHLATPMAFLAEAWRALGDGGRVILVEPHISLLGRVVYGAFHPEPIALRKPIDWSTRPAASGYYAAQGNATRIFFGEEAARWSEQWRLLHAERWSGLEYVLSGGFSRPAFYPRRLRPLLARADALLSRWPSLFAVRSIVVLQRRA